MAGTMRVRAEGPWSDLALHTIGWKAFQDLCAQVCEEVLRRPVQVYREAQDGGQDAVASCATLSPSHFSSSVARWNSSHDSSDSRSLAGSVGGLVRSISGG